MTTEAKAKALRPVAEKLITKAKKAQDDDPMRVHRIRQIQAYLGDREMTVKLVDEVAPRYLQRPRRLHPDPEARSAPGRQRPHGPHRTGVGSSFVAHPPLRFGWLLLASLGNASGAAAVGRRSQTHRLTERSVSRRRGRAG